eukprot:5283823-Heterocapsa_arctica.AAC.1
MKSWIILSSRSQSSFPSRRLTLTFVDAASGAAARWWEDSALGSSPPSCGHRSFLRMAYSIPSRASSFAKCA